MWEGQRQSCWKTHRKAWRCTGEALRAGGQPCPMHTFSRNSQGNLQSLEVFRDPAATADWSGDRPLV